MSINKGPLITNQRSKPSFKNESLQLKTTHYVNYSSNSGKRLNQVIRLIDKFSSGRKYF